MYIKIAIYQQLSEVKDMKLKKKKGTIFYKKKKKGIEQLSSC